MLWLSPALSVYVQTDTDFSLLHNFLAETHWLDHCKALTFLYSGGELNIYFIYCPKLSKKIVINLKKKEEKKKKKFIDRYKDRWVGYMQTFLHHLKISLYTLSGFHELKLKIGI